MEEEKKNHKKFYWLKLRENFFASKEIKKLRRIAGGDTYTIIYLKLQLLSLKNNGVLMFDGLEETIQEELALEIDEDIENVKITLSYLSKTGLIEQSDDNEYTLTETIKNIGSECDSAERVRKFREVQNNKKLLCNASVTIGNTEKRLELKKEIKDNIHKEDSPERNHYFNWDELRLTLADDWYTRVVDAVNDMEALNLTKEEKDKEYKNILNYIELGKEFFKNNQIKEISK